MLATGISSSPWTACVSGANLMIPHAPMCRVFLKRHRLVVFNNTVTRSSCTAASECVPVSLDMSVDLPTEGNPRRSTRALPEARTSKPSPLPPPDPLTPSTSLSHSSRVTAREKGNLFSPFLCRRENLSPHFRDTCICSTVIHGTQVSQYSNVVF